MLVVTLWRQKFHSLMPVSQKWPFLVWVFTFPFVSPKGPHRWFSTNKRKNPTQICLKCQIPQKTACRFEMSFSSSVFIPTEVSVTWRPCPDRRRSGTKLRLGVWARRTFSEPGCSLGWRNRRLTASLARLDGTNLCLSPPSLLDGEPVKTEDFRSLA